MSVEARSVKLNTFRSAWPIALFFFLSCLFLWRIFTGEVFVPAELLRHIAPWSANYSEQDRPPWNPLMYDSVGQFYPWRKFASESLRSGYIPLWNPYQFCGTPFVANSQSAVFYPGNFLFYVLPTDIAAGWSVILHLTMAASFMWFFVRALGASSGAAVISGIVFAFSTWQVAWLHLPTFLTTSCWLPLILLLLLKLSENPSWTLAVGLGFSVGMTLLAGHLQIAFYVLFTGVLFALYLALMRWKARGFRSIVPLMTLGILGLSLGVLIAAPQLLLTFELSRFSHRSGAATEGGYGAYTSYAAHPFSLISLVLPDMFGLPSSGVYFGHSRGGMIFNFAEGAMYVGLATLILAGVSVAAGRSLRRWSVFFGALALLAFLMAFGTVVDRLFYFVIPGFASSGSPARSLVLWAFSSAALAGIGAESLLKSEKPPMRTLILWIGALVLLWAWMYPKSTGWITEVIQGNIPAAGGLQQQAALMAISAIALLLVASRKVSARLASGLVLGLVCVDLLANGVNLNPTARRSEVYPITPMVEAAQANAAHDRVVPINTDWSFGGPRAVMPPNSGMVFGLRDAQGYDSLFPGQYKAYLNQLARADVSPPEVGNMVFVPNGWEDQLGARLVIRPHYTNSATERSVLNVTEASEPYEVRKMDQYQGRMRIWSAKYPAPSATWHEDSVTRVEIDVTSAANGELHLKDQFYPGWHAKIDSRPARILRDDTGGMGQGVFRNVRFPAGNHRITFRYEPMGFRFGLFLMGVALAVGGFTVALMWSRKGAQGAVPAI